MKQLSLLLIVLTVVSSCGLIGGRRERGNGQITTDARSEKGFTGVKTYGSFELQLTNASDYSVKIETDQNLLQYIRTHVEDGNLIVSTERHISLRPSHGIKVYVSAPQFQDITSSGSGEVTATNQLTGGDELHVGISGSGDINLNIKGQSVHADISGSGSIALDGTATSLDGSIAGNGDIKAQKLAVETASITISGSGNANLNASKKLDVQIAGSGDVLYSGNPQVSQHIAGSGSIQKQESQ